MIILLSAARRHIAASLLVAALFCTAVGCKPSPPTISGQPTPPTEHRAPRQPTQEDFTTFFQGTMSSWVRLTEVKMDPPVPMPNTSPADNVWLCKVKVTLVPTEDLLVHPSTEDAAAIDGLVNELNALVNWRSLYVKSPFARACGDVEVKVPTASVPQFLVVQHAKGQPLQPVYGKMAAEWQVDHWQFSVVDMNLAVDGKPRSDYPGNTMVKGSAEAEGFLKSERDAIAQARETDRRPSKLPLRGAGRQRHQARHSLPPVAVTFRTERRSLVKYASWTLPPGADEHFANLEVKLPNENPPCVVQL